MPRRPNIVRPTKLNLALPEDIRLKLDLHLFSQVEGRIPVGAYQNFIIERIKEFFTHKAVDMSETFSRPAGTLIVRGDDSSCAAVRSMLEALTAGATHG